MIDRESHDKRRFECAALRRVGGSTPRQEATARWFQAQRVVKIFIFDQLNMIVLHQKNDAAQGVKNAGQVGEDGALTSPEKRNRTPDMLSLS